MVWIALTLEVGYFVSALTLQKKKKFIYLTVDRLLVVIVPELFLSMMPSCS